MEFQSENLTLEEMMQTILKKIDLEFESLSGDFLKKVFTRLAIILSSIY